MRCVHSWFKGIGRGPCSSLNSANRCHAWGVVYSLFSNGLGRTVSGCVAILFVPLLFLALNQLSCHTITLTCWSCGARLSTNMISECAVGAVEINHFLQSACQENWNTPHKKNPHIPEKEQARLWDNLSAWGQGASRLHPACSVQGKCRWLLPENTSTLPKSRLCPSSCASSNSACDFSTKSSAHESNFESPQKNCLCVWCLKVPLRKLKEREITSKSPGGFSCKWEAYVIW